MLLHKSRQLFGAARSGRTATDPNRCLSRLEGRRRSLDGRRPRHRPVPRRPPATKPSGSPPVYKKPIHAQPNPKRIHHIPNRNNTAQNASDGSANDEGSANESSSEGSASERSASDDGATGNRSHLQRPTKRACNQTQQPKAGEQKTYTFSEIRSNLLTSQQETEPWTEVHGIRVWPFRKGGGRAGAGPKR